MLEAADFFWGIIVSLVAAAWFVILFIRDRNSASREYSNSLIKKLHESDKLIIEHPEIQKYLSLTMMKNESFFRAPEILHDDEFYKAKAFAYWNLNLFDEILSMATASRSKLSLLMPAIVELSDWENYIKHKLRHPLYHAILNHEGSIFGAGLRDFWNDNKTSLETTAIDPYSW